MRLFLKKFLSLSLILTLSIPAFSAVSVSDGSAFVSKAEFSTDFNALSNRMAQLENSLDAKIDSLVSSYLSRNGIWNGEKQEIVSSVTISNKNAAIVRSHNTYYLETNSTKLLTVSKSGLLNFKLKFPPFTHVNLSDNAFSYGPLTLYFVYLITNKVASSVSASSSSQLYPTGTTIYADLRAQGSYMAGYSLMNTSQPSEKIWYTCLYSNDLPEQSFETYFFVSKGDTLYFSFLSIVSQYLNAGTWAWEKGTMSTTNPTATTNWSNNSSLLQATVY